MNESRIQELRALCDAATPGPWTSAHAGGGTEHYVYDDVVHSLTHTRGRQKVAWVTGWTQPDADANFIAASRTALSECLDEIERLRAGNEAIRKSAQRAAEIRSDPERLARLIGEAE